MRRTLVTVTVIASPWANVILYFVFQFFFILCLGQHARSKSNTRKPEGRGKKTATN